MFAIVVRREDGSVELLDGGETLFANLESIAGAAADASLPALEDFADDREPPADFDGDPDELREILGPFDTWFEGAEAAAGLTKLAEFIRTDEPEVGDALLELAGRLGDGPRFQLDIA